MIADHWPLPRALLLRLVGRWDGAGPDNDPGLREAFVAVTGAWPLVGRDEERDLAIDAVCRDGSRGIVVTGSAGVGKTRFVHELLSDLGSRGYATEWVVGTRAAATIPFGAMAPLLPVTPERTSDRLEEIDVMQAIRQAISGRAGGGELVLGVDDAHCLDEASAALVHQLCAMNNAVVVVTLRNGERVSDAITALWKDNLVVRIELQALSEAESHEVLRGLLGAPITVEAASQFVTRSAGNPLYLREAVHAAQSDALLVEGDEGWHLRRPLTTGRRLVELVVDHVRGLGEAGQQVLDLLAVGEPLPLTILEELSAPNGLDEAETKELVAIVQDGQRAVRPPRTPDVRRGHTGTDVRNVRAGAPARAWPTVSSTPACGAVTTSCGSPPGASTPACAPHRRTCSSPPGMRSKQPMRSPPNDSRRPRSRPAPGPAPRSRSPTRWPGKGARPRHSPRSIARPSTTRSTGRSSHCCA